MNKRYLTGLLALFVGLDLVVTFWQNYNLPLDGDLVAIVLPSPWYTQVLHDPFGWSVLTQHAVYGATNRFFVHAEMGLYWKVFPRLFQFITTPVNSLYLTNALFATCTQAGVLFLLVKYIQVNLSEPQRPARFWLLAALLGPLFQTAGGFYEQMGVTDRAATYTFFYAFATLLVLALAWPFYQAIYSPQPLRLPWLRALLLLALMPVVALGGPIGVATLLVLLLGAGSQWVWQQVSGPPKSNWLSGQALVLLSVMAGLSLYSLYIGRNNVENDYSHTLVDLYRILPEGIARYLTYQAGLPLLLTLIAGNILLTWRIVKPTRARQQVLRAMAWVGLLITCYLLLLPLGGYRAYRPNLLRNDTALPIVLSVFFAYGLSTYFLLTNLQGIRRWVYTLLVCVAGAFFLYQDNQHGLNADNGCERWSLDQLAQAPEPVVELGSDCNVLTWVPIHNAQESELHAQMLYYWHITPSKKLYYQK